MFEFISKEFNPDGRKRRRPPRRPSAPPTAAQPIDSTSNPPRRPLSPLTLADTQAIKAGRRRTSRRLLFGGGSGILRSGVGFGPEGEQIIGRLGGRTRRAHDGAVVLTQHLEPGAKIVGVPDRRHDAERRADKGAGYFGYQFFERVLLRAE